MKSPGNMNIFASLEFSLRLKASERNLATAIVRQSRTCVRAVELRHRT